VLYLLKVLLNSPQAVVAAWIIVGIFAVLLGCLCVALKAALFHPDPEVRKSAKEIFKTLLKTITKRRGQ
jgi:hypothetical protein